MKPLKPGPLLPEKGGVLFSSSFFRDSALTCAINSKVFFAIPGKLICVSSKIVFLFLREQMDARRREVFLCKISAQPSPVTPYKDGHKIFVHKIPAGLGYWNAHGFFVVPETLQLPA